MYIFSQKHLHLLARPCLENPESRVGEKFGKKKGTPRAPHLNFFGEEKIVTYDL